MKEVHSEEVKKVRRKIEETLRNGTTEQIILIARLLGINVNNIDNQKHR